MFGLFTGGWYFCAGCDNGSGELNVGDATKKMESLTSYPLSEQSFTIGLLGYV